MCAFSTFSIFVFTLIVFLIFSFNQQLQHICRLGSSRGDPAQWEGLGLCTVSCSFSLSGSNDTGQPDRNTLQDRSSCTLCFNHTAPVFELSSIPIRHKHWVKTWNVFHLIQFYLFFKIVLTAPDDENTITGLDKRCVNHFFEFACKIHSPATVLDTPVSYCLLTNIRPRVIGWLVSSSSLGRKCLV